MPRRIEICGGIASGKTTLAQALVRATDAQLVSEQFRENPFWQSYYNDPAAWAQEKNIVFLLQHTGAIKSAGNVELLICDYAVVQDLAYASLVASAKHQALMHELYCAFYSVLPAPELIMHFTCPPS